MEASRTDATTAIASPTTAMNPNNATTIPPSSASINNNNNNNNSGNSILSSAPVWPTIDGPLGLTEDESLSHARRFYKFGYALLPWLWAVNCFYFWPVLRHSRSFPLIRPYVVRSAVGFSIFTALLCSWALTFAIGGDSLFGPVWDKLVMYNVADKLGLTGEKYKLLQLFLSSRMELGYIHPAGAGWGSSSIQKLDQNLYRWYFVVEIFGRECCV